MSDEEARRWKQTVRDVFDECHGTGRKLASRLVALIEARHPDYFCAEAKSGGLTVHENSP